MRVDNWSLRLNEQIEAAQQRAFSWGEWDCCQFGAAVVAALTGRDPRSIFPSYANEAEAMQIVEVSGGFEGLITAALGEKKHPAFSQRGDIVLCDFGRGPQPAVCVGVYCIAPGPRGLERRPTDNALAAWTV